MKWGTLASILGLLCMASPAQAAWNGALVEDVVGDASPSSIDITKASVLYDSTTGGFNVNVWLASSPRTSAGVSVVARIMKYTPPSTCGGNAIRANLFVDNYTPARDTFPYSHGTDLGAGSGQLISTELALLASATNPLLAGKSYDCAVVVAESQGGRDELLVWFDGFGPAADLDGDGVRNEIDGCPTQSAAAADGCPVLPPTPTPVPTPPPALSPAAQAEPGPETICTVPKGMKGKTLAEARKVIARTDDCILGKVKRPARVPRGYVLVVSKASLRQDGSDKIDLVLRAVKRR